MKNHEVRIHHQGDEIGKFGVMFSGSKTACVRWMRDAIKFDTIASAKELKKDRSILRWQARFVAYYIEPEVL